MVVDFTPYLGICRDLFLDLCWLFVFEHLPHPRSHINRRHDLLDIMFLSVAVTLSGAQGCKDIKMFGDAKLERLGKFRGFEADIPVDDTLAGE